MSEGAKKGAQDDHGHQRHQRAEDADHDDIEITIAVGDTAHGEQGHHGAIVWQAVQGAGAITATRWWRPGSMPMAEAKRRPR